MPILFFRDEQYRELSAEALIGLLREHIHKMRTQVKELGKK